MPDSIPENTSTTAIVVVGGSVTSEIDESGDRDWFAVSLTAGNTYLIDLEGSPTSAGTLSDPYLSGIYNSSGSLISGTTNDDGGTSLNSQLEFTATSSGTHYISAGAFSSNIGTYRLSIDDQGGGDVDDHGETAGTAGSIAVDGSVTGEIEVSGDRDWFAVSLTA
ncbi:MAG: pre-peptidase C-terminal domain-containing protein, partial [Pseudohongiellaceae bacterium]